MANVIGTFVNSETFLNTLASTAPNDIYVINNCELEDIVERTKQDLAPVARTGSYSSLNPPATKEQLCQAFDWDPNTIQPFTGVIDASNVDSLETTVSTIISNLYPEMGGGSGEGVYVPSALSEFTNDTNFITAADEADPIFTNSPAAGITAANITSWNEKASSAELTAAIDNLSAVARTGSFNDLSIKPDFIKRYDLTVSPHTALADLANNTVLSDISTTLFNTGGSSILNYFMGIIETYQSQTNQSQTNRSLLQLHSNIGDFFITSIQQIERQNYEIDNNYYHVNFYKFNFTPIVETNYMTLVNQNGADVLNNLTSTIIHLHLLLDITNDRIIIKRFQT